MIALYATLLGAGSTLCVLAALWAWRTRHERRLWRRTRHDTSTVAIVLELEEKVRELDEISLQTVDLR